METAILIIDVQQFFINKYTKDIPQKIASFIKKNSFDQIYFFKFVNDKRSNWFKAGWKKMMSAPETNIVPELQSFSNSTNTFSKNAFSVFRAKGFDEILKKNNIRKLLICGLDTHACIYATTLEAYERGYEVRVITDLCAASHGKEYHESALNSLSKNLGDKVLITSRDINN